MHTRERVVPVTARVATLKGPDAGLYYVEGLPSYYLDAGEPAGMWRGEGAEMLGLVGEVKDDAFLDLMAGLDPNTGEPLGRAYGENSVRGFDVTASAPKSVSVLFALGDDATRAAVLEAHDAAVAAMVDWIEDHAHTRYRIDGQVAMVDAEGIVAATFRQHTSRALDPQLHTHVVIANRVASDDLRWLALDARTIKLDQRTLSGIYHAGLRAELSRSLGVGWEEPVNGIAEMRDVAEDLRQEFSSRTRVVEERIEEKLERFVEEMERDPTPRERWRLEREAVTDSRPAKAHGEDAGSLHAEWAARAGAIGFDADHIMAGLAVAEKGRRDIDDATQELIVTRALDTLAEKQSSWRPAELVRELAAAVPTDVTVAAATLVPWLDRVADEVIAERLLDISAPIVDGVRLRRDGRPVTESVADRALTTPEILAQEERVIAWAERRLGAGGGEVALDAAEQLGHLSKPQVEAAGALAGTADLVLVVGPAGAGKTSAVAPAIEQLRREGRAVFGVAPSAAAAEVLATDAGLAADTLDKLLVEHRLDRPPDHRYDLPAGATVVVDEAAMVSTPKLADLADLADARGWRLALVGDPLQFSAVGRSGMFGHLIDSYGAIELDRVHRFAHDWEREASLRLRRGEAEVLDLYDDHGRLHGGTRRQMEQAVVEAWWAARSHGEEAAMMAPTNDTVVSLNIGAQQRRADAGEIDLSGSSVDAGQYRLVAGDVIATRHNDRQRRTDRGLMVKNRDQWEVLGVHQNGALSVSGATGGVCLPRDYVAQHVELAYAQTSHANQGRTVDRSFFLLDGPADTRGVYVPMTRGRQGNDAFVVTEGEQTPRDVLAEALARDWIDEPAVARRAELRTRARDGGARTVDVPLPGPELRELLERHHSIAQTLRWAEVCVGLSGKQLAGAMTRRDEVAGRLAAAQERQQAAQQVIDDHDHPLRRRLHRDELQKAHADVRREALVQDRHAKDLAAADGEISGLRSSIAEAQDTLRRRPALDAERRGIRMRLDRDLNARKPGLVFEPSRHVTDLLGERPRNGTARLWDDAAARIDQHRSAFAIADDGPALGKRQHEIERSAFADSQREVLGAAERLNHSLGRERVIEGPVLERPFMSPGR